MIADSQPSLHVKVDKSQIYQDTDFLCSEESESSEIKYQQLLAAAYLNSHGQRLTAWIRIESSNTVPNALPAA